MKLRAKLKFSNSLQTLLVYLPFSCLSIIMYKFNYFLPQLLSSAFSDTRFEMIIVRFRKDFNFVLFKQFKILSKSRFCAQKFCYIYLTSSGTGNRLKPPKRMSAFILFVRFTEWHPELLNIFELSGVCFFSINSVIQIDCLFFLI